MTSQRELLLLLLHTERKMVKGSSLFILHKNGSHRKYITIRQFSFFFVCSPQLCYYVSVIQYTIHWGIWYFYGCDGKIDGKKGFWVTYNDNEAQFYINIIVFVHSTLLMLFFPFSSIVSITWQKLNKRGTDRNMNTWKKEIMSVVKGFSYRQPCFWEML